VTFANEDMNMTTSSSKYELDGSSCSGSRILL